MRILIAEDQSVQRSRIEKTLNELGYRTPVKVQCFRELMRLTHYSYEPFERFDLLIINGEMLVDAGVDPYQFFTGNRQIRHGLIYDARRGRDQPEVLHANARRQLRLIRTPDRQTLGSILESIDV